MNNRLSTISPAKIIGLLLFIVIVLLFFLVINYGYLTVDYSGTVYVNEKVVESKKIRLRPGSYSIRLNNKEYDNQTQIVKVYPLINKKIEFSKITPDQIQNVAINTPPDINDYTYNNGVYLFNGSWFIARYINNNDGGRYVIAFQYIFDSWQARLYYPSNNAEENISILPESVYKLYEEYKKANALD